MRGDDEYSFPFPELDRLRTRREELRRDGTSPGALARCEARLKDLEGKFPVWEENRRAIEVFYRVRTQWNTGMSGATGLRYEAVTIRVAAMKLPPNEEARVWQDLELMETVILKAWGDESDRRAKELDSKRGRR